MLVGITLRGLTGLTADLQPVLHTAQIKAYESVAWQGGY